MNQNDLIQKLSKKLHLRKHFTKTIINTICDEITKELRGNKRFYLQKLGAFHPINRPARRWRDPKTGKVKTKPAYKDIIFRPSKIFFNHIQKGNNIID